MVGETTCKEDWDAKFSDMKPWHYKHPWHMLRRRTGIPSATFKSMHHSVSESACTEGRFVVFLGQDLAYVTLPMTDWFDLLVVCVDAARWFSNPPDLRHNTSCAMNTSREPGWTMFKTSDPTRCCFHSGFTSEVLKWSTKLVFFLPESTWTARESFTRVVESLRLTGMHSPSLCEPSNPEQCNTAFW